MTIKLNQLKIAQFRFKQKWTLTNVQDFKIVVTSKSVLFRSVNKVNLFSVFNIVILSKVIFGPLKGN